MTAISRTAETDELAEIYDEAATNIELTSYALGEAQLVYRNVLIHHEECSRLLSDATTSHANMQRVVSAQSRRLRRRHVKSLRQINAAAHAETERRIREEKEAYALKLSALISHRRLSWCDVHSAQVAFFTASSALGIAHASKESCEASYELAKQGWHIVRYLDRSADLEGDVLE